MARFNENVDWTKQFENVTIYNKGEPLPEEFDEIRLFNVGREGHTYFTHIVDNYEKLDDYTIFLQANPFDHSPNVLETIWRLQKAPLDFEFISEQIIQCRMSGCHYHLGLPLRETYTTIFGVAPNEQPFVFGAGAQFIVSKKFILKRPLAFYQKIVTLLQPNISPIEGYVVERFHGLIFNGHT